MISKASEYLTAAIRDGMAVMTMGFTDVYPVITCLTGNSCGLTFRGDSATDAWRLWYEHLHQAHPGWGE